MGQRVRSYMLTRCFLLILSASGQFYSRLFLVGQRRYHRRPMAKPIDHSARRQPSRPGTRTLRRKSVNRRRGTLARQPPRRARNLLDRILDTPLIAHVIPRLPPESLHRVIQTCGLEDCGELVALATPEQLARVFDLDLWRHEQPGQDEELDIERFGQWLEVLLECGASLAAEKVTAIDVDLMVAGFSGHFRVFDPGADSSAATDDEEWETVRSGHQGPASEVGGYLVLATRNDSWDAIMTLLIELDAAHPDCFHRIMRGCRRRSNALFELDGLDDLLSDDEQAVFDLEIDREGRREKQGYVTPAQARAFLQMSRHLRLSQDAAPPADPVIRAYFRGLEVPAVTDRSSERKHLIAPSSAPAAEVKAPIEDGSPLDQPDSTAALATVVDLLRDAGLIDQQPRALLRAPDAQASPLGLMHVQMQFAGENDRAAAAARNQELAYLANAIMTGCSIQARSFTPQEASDAAMAVCNLGLENWPMHWLAPSPRRRALVAESPTALPDTFLIDHDLVRVFQVGWTVLYERVCMHGAERLIDTLKNLRAEDQEVQIGLDALRREMAKHWRAGSPWLAREALDVIEILNMPAWAALLGLIDQCPVLHAGVEASLDVRARAVSSSAFEFISQNTQIATVHRFTQSLNDILQR